jgi:hypothetical protein
MIIITIKGGCIQHVTSDLPNQTFIVYDLDADNNHNSMLYIETVEYDPGWVEEITQQTAGPAKKQMIRY